MPASLKAALPVRLHTDRLTLELFDYSQAHYECLLNAMNSPTAHANMGDYGIRTTEQFDALNASTRLSPARCKSMSPDTDVYYLLRLRKDTQPLIGGVSMTQRAQLMPPDLGWCILEPFMGYGYAAEAGQALRSMAEEKLGQHELIAWPGSSNTRSLRVAQKIGFVEGGIVDLSEGPSAVYILPGMSFDSLDLSTLSLWGEGDPPSNDRASGVF